ncbi:MAG TPA: DUF116 domain-containing protein [Candidatus Cloacimonadota bacterium]|nr:DUF116 domain-containing protein [Candidatus Cloacimonadota bacterium]
MPKRKESNFEPVFPLSVSTVLLVLLAIALIIGMHLQTKVFFSVFDHTAYYVFLTVVILLCMIWLLILCLELAGVSFGKLYCSSKWLLFFIYYPLAWVADKLVRMPIERMQTSLLLFQNRLFIPYVQKQVKGKRKILILLPHCLQFHDCKIRVTRTIDDCAECGNCSLKELKQLGKRENIHIGIANGGTLARKIVRDTNPDYIIAVACHRDLTSGVRDSWQYPVYAVLNERPNGPCYDTQVKVDEIGQIIHLLTNSTEQAEKAHSAEEIPS